MFEPKANQSIGTQNQNGKTGTNRFERLDIEEDGEGFNQDKLEEQMEEDDESQPHIILENSNHEKTSQQEEIQEAIGSERVSSQDTEIHVLSMDNLVRLARKSSISKASTSKISNSEPNT